MTEICYGLEEEYQEMARDQDIIGWRRFMEGMICKRKKSRGCITYAKDSVYHQSIGRRG
jgi:hypothetical protein